MSDPEEPGSSVLAAEEAGQIAAAGSLQAVAAGELVFEAGDLGDCMYVIEAGELEILFGDERPAKVLGRHATVGELALIAGPHRRTASVRASRDTRLRRLDPGDIEALQVRFPELVASLVRRSCAYLIASERRLVEDLRARNAELERTLRYLHDTREELDAAEIAARTDRLTGLHNRRGLHARIPDLLGRAPHDGGLALLLIDLDHFKGVNDTHGHPVGDAVLTQMGAQLQRRVRRSDLACRLGGDEFAVVLTSIAAGDAGARARSLYMALRQIEVRTDDGSPLHVTTTMGGTAWRPGESWDDLFRRSDESLYAAKRAGRACLAWDEAIVGQEGSGGRRRSDR